MIPGLKKTRSVESVRIAIGEKGELGKKLPTKLSHFIFTTTQKQDGRYLREPELTELFGDKPKKIPIMLLSDDIEVVLPTFYAKYARSGVKLRSDDAEHWTIYNDDGSRTLQTCDPDDCEYLQDKDVKPHGILTGVIDCASMDNANHIGEKLFKFRTTSWNTMHALLYEMNRVKDACGGHLAYLPLNLIVFPKMVRPKGSSGEVRAYIVSLEPRTTMADLRMHAAVNAKSLAAIGSGALVQEAVRLSDPEEETVEEQIAVKEEFSPDPMPQSTSEEVIPHDPPDEPDPSTGAPSAKKTTKHTNAPANKDNATQTQADTSASNPVVIHDLPKGKNLIPVQFPDALADYPITSEYPITAKMIDEAGTHWDVGGSGVWTDGTLVFSDASAFVPPHKCVHVAVVYAIARFGIDEVKKAFPKVFLFGDD